MEPDSRKNLFERSDHFPFARKGVAAHTIMASDDDDACYHKACDTNRFINRRSVRVLSKAIADTTYRFAMTARDLRSAGMSGSGTGSTRPVPEPFRRSCTR